MAPNEKQIADLEIKVPGISGQAFVTARLETLASGQSVLSSEQGIIYRVAPDGSRVPLKTIEPPVPVQRGAKVALK